ncbi:MAG: PAS domain S-box protein, partial [Bryobacteraceae bacterium]
MEFSARMGVAPADPRWVQRYREDLSLWNESIAEARSVNPELYRGQAARGLIGAAAKASAMEREAFLLARQGAVDPAVALLFSETYEMLHRLMSDHGKDLADAIRLQIESNLNAQRKQGILALSSFFLILPAILFTWIFGVQVTARHISRRRRAEEALRESEERFRTMADHAPILIWMAGTDQDYTYFNRGWLEFTGRTLEQEAGKGWMEGVCPDDLSHCRKVRAEAINERREFGMDYRLSRSDGEYRWIFDHGTPRFLSDGRFAGYIGCCTDVTERRRVEEQLRESEQRLRTLFEGIDDALLVHDLEGRILDCNPAARRRLGYTRDELLTLRTSDIDSPEFTAGFAERVAI